MITTTIPATSLADLSQTEWRLVATRIRGAANWQYSIPLSEVGEFHAQRDKGRIIAPQRRDETVDSLVAKLAKGAR